MTRPARRRLGDGDDFVFGLESLVEVGGTAGDDLLDGAKIFVEAQQRADADELQLHLDGKSSKVVAEK